MNDISNVKKLFPVMILLGGLVFPMLIYGQTESEKLSPEEYFDFWVGDWDLTWEAPDGTIEKGSNKVEKILNGMVILENFKALTGRFKGYEGKSFSVLRKQSGTWRQTWVDSNQGYIDLSGALDGNKRIFQTESPGPGGKMMKKRMVYYDITNDGFTWDWETSIDDGKTWKLQWRIHYKRSK